MNKQIYNYAVEKLINTRKLSLGDMMWNNGKNSTDSLKVLRRLWRDGIVRECENGEYALVDIRVLAQYREAVKDADCHTENALRYRAQMITKKEYETLVRIANDERCSLVDDDKAQVELYYKLLDRRLCYTFNGLVHCDLTESDLKIVKKMIGVTPDEKPTPEEVEKKKEELRARQKEREEEKKQSTLDDAIRSFKEKQTASVKEEPKPEPPKVEPKKQSTKPRKSTTFKLNVKFDSPFAKMTVPVTVKRIQTVAYAIKQAMEGMLPTEQTELFDKKQSAKIDEGLYHEVLKAKFVYISDDEETVLTPLEMNKALNLQVEEYYDGTPTPSELFIVVEPRNFIKEEFENDNYAIAVELISKNDNTVLCRQEDLFSRDTTVMDAVKNALNVAMLYESTSNNEILYAYGFVANGAQGDEYTAYSYLQTDDGYEEQNRLNWQESLFHEMSGDIIETFETGYRAIIRVFKK